MIQTPIRIILADDHEIFRDGFNVMLNKQGDIKLIGEASNGSELIEITENLMPDVIITDIKMPVLDGIEATKSIMAKFPGISIIALSMFDDESFILEMLEAGAKGYLLKSSNKNEIIEAIKTVYNDEPYYCRATSAKLVQMIAKSQFNPYKKLQKPEFSQREIEIIKLICEEATNKGIAEKLFVSVRTVEGHRLRILEKMQVKNTVGLVVYAIKNGIVLSS